LANIVVFVELRDGQPTAPALFALGEARRAANALGATVYALVVAGALAPEAIDELPGPLGASGADKVLLCVGPALAGPPIDPVYAGLLDQVVKTLRPRLFLWPAGSVGLQLAPPLALRAGAAFFPRASIELGEGAAKDAPAALALRRLSADLDGVWTLTLTGSNANAVATLSAGRAQAPSAGGETELQLLSPPVPSAAAIEVLETTPDPEADLELASLLIVAGGADREKTVAELRAAGAPAGTTVLSDLPADGLGDACPALVVILGGKPYPPGLARVRVAPAAQVVLAGKRAAVPSPLVNALWQVDRARATAMLGAALADGEAGDAR
jgi:electron transfer flavoprotein alpha subunit